MKEQDNEKEVYKLEKKLIKDGRKEFVLEIQRGTKTEVEAKFLSLAKHFEEIQNTQKADTELTSLQQKVKEIKAPYNEQRKANGVLRRYVSLMLKENFED